ncbi:SAP domain-containing protein [Lactobacillus johnsonii]|uniref:SAP domain-containing protein n=1 Tax=Lactobacillus johnsonii TaxID=33959 RepID=UPI0028EA5A70|nr:SAP domain-containing protein [Lactobacillus johnsonii]MDT9606538.1 SAP domain-containing protein [Lactobacillus johnsonii]
MSIEIPKSITEFEHTYYYKTDLVKICKSLSLPTSGTKAELNSYIMSYLNRMPATQIKPKRRKKSRRSLTYQEINLDTKLVDSGFSFNNEARHWFADYFGVEKFSFKKEMAVVKRKSEAENNTNITVRDLIYQIEHWNQEEIGSVAEEQTYQWNNFVHNFFEDPATEKYQNRLKIAAVLWKLVRESSNRKIYSHGLLRQYEKEIHSYKKDKA